MLTRLKTLEAQWEKAPRKSKSEEKLIDFSEKSFLLYFSLGFLAEKIISSRVVWLSEESWQLGTENLLIIREARTKLQTKQKVCVSIIKIEWKRRKSYWSTKNGLEREIFFFRADPRNVTPTADLSHTHRSCTHLSRLKLSEWDARNHILEHSLPLSCPHLSRPGRTFTRECII